VEGIGEDFLPTALDLSVVDAIERAGDRESFLWARQLVRQEGIFAGGSSGSAMAGAIKYCRRLNGNRLPVVLLPDSGSRYLSKFYDDKWMRESGFLSMEFGETSLGDLLIAKTGQGFVHSHDWRFDSQSGCRDAPAWDFANACRRRGWRARRLDRRSGSAQSHAR
jgi:hypothetical protein